MIKHIAITLLQLAIRPGLTRNSYFLKGCRFKLAWGILTTVRNVVRGGGGGGVGVGVGGGGAVLHAFELNKRLM